MGRLQQMLLLLLLLLLACLPDAQRAVLALEEVWHAAAPGPLQPRASSSQPLGCCRHIMAPQSARQSDHLAVLHAAGHSLAAPARARTSSLRPQWTLWLRSPSCDILNMERAA
jgi:hypothetical protein